jgi:DNA-binding NarL/FixJ family response regulator
LHKRGARPREGHIQARVADLANASVAGATTGGHISVRRLTKRYGALTVFNDISLEVGEREIVALVAQGYKNKEMAEKMFISEQTVKNHLHNIFDKLGVSDRLELALYAIHKNLHNG